VGRRDRRDRVPPPVPSADRAVSQQITFLDTRDLRRTADFYERVLGLRLARDQGTCRIYHVSGTAYVGFCEKPDAPGEPRGLVLTLVTDEVDRWCAHLRSEGVEFVKAPADNPRYRIYNAFVRDPNGYVIEIQRFWEPLV
jgi:catechol 2,3-dioxygenase-like lactoylglutathione lyase family enzyme